MGNRNSTTALPSENGINDDDNTTTLVNESGVFLTNDLNAEIVNSFKNQEIQFKFMQLQNQILTNHNNNTAKNELRRMEVESQMKEWREGNELVQKQLDEQMDGVRSKFADVQVGLNYDVGLLEKKFETVPKFGGKDSCLDIRSNLVSCYKHKGDIRECELFVEAMEQCTKQTIMST